MFTRKKMGIKLLKTRPHMVLRDFHATFYSSLNIIDVAAILFIAWEQLGFDLTYSRPEDKWFGDLLDIDGKVDFECFLFSLEDCFAVKFNQQEVDCIKTVSDLFFSKKLQERSAY